MEANRKRKGFIKGRLSMSLYRAPKVAAPPTSHYNIKAKSPIPSANNYTRTNAKVGFIVNHDSITPQPKHKVAIAQPEYDSYKKFENFYGVVADESVDLKAASYISSVQERFKLERVNSERKTSQDMQ